MFALFENLRVFENRYEELNLKLYDPATAAQRDLYASLMKEHKELEPIVETYRAYCRCQEDLAGARELLEEGQRELREMAQQEIREKGEELSRLEEELKLLLLPKDPNDEKNVIVEIRGGAGGEEAALFAYTLYRMYTMYAEKKGWKTEIVGLNETELGGFKEVSFLIDGEVLGLGDLVKHELRLERPQLLVAVAGKEGILVDSLLLEEHIELVGGDAALPCHVPVAAVELAADHRLGHRDLDL